MEGHLPGHDGPGLKSAATTPLPFWSPLYDASFETVASVMAKKPSPGVILAGTDAMTGNTNRRGHTQGIAVGAERVITSCMTKSIWSDEGGYDGFLQIYKDGNSWGDGHNVHLYGAPTQHAAVGQGVIGKNVKDSMGNTHVDEIGMLVPIANGGVKGIIPFGQCESPIIDLRDRDGNLIFSFCHVPHKDDSKSDLACCALVVWLGRLYLVAVRHQFLYVYKIHWFGGADSDAFVAEEKIVELNMGDDNEVETVTDGGHNVKWPHYESINLFLTWDGQAYLLGGHEKWLDTWHLGLLNPEPPEKPKVTKLAKMQFNLPGSKDLFFEGVAIAKWSGDHRRVGFWCAPWDYRFSRCPEYPWSFENMCTHIWFFERSW